MITLPFAGSLLALLLPSNARNGEAWLAGAVALAVLVLASVAYPAVAAHGTVRNEMEWLPTLGVNFTLRMDGFAWLFATMISAIGFLVVLYARYYMSPEDPIPRFYAFFLAFMGAMLGVVLSGNLIVLVVFWELTSIFSFLLIGYWYHNANARDGARMALTITGIGGLGLLAGVLLIGHIVGSYDLDVVLASGDMIRVARALRACARAGAAGRADEERAVPVPLLAAERHGRADAGLGLSAFGDHGEGRRVPAGAVLAGARRHLGMVLDRRLLRHDVDGARRLLRDLPARHQRPARLFDDQPSRPDHAAAQPRQPARRRRRHLPHGQPRDVQGLAVHGGRHHRPRERHARHAAARRPVPLHAATPPRSRWWQARPWPACRC